jgi:nucleoside-diphosphate-sugar epimerase
VDINVGLVPGELDQKLPRDGSHDQEDRKMPGGRILVTGGSGLVGANAVQILLDGGEQPVILDALLNERLLTAVGIDLTVVPVVRGDVLDLPSLLSTIREFEIDRIIHLAALLGEEVQRRPYSGVRLNLMGTLNVLEAARLEGVRRVVFPSSGTVYLGSLASSGIKIIDESIPLNPLSVYAATKAGAEFLGRTYAERYGFEFVTVRFAALYGPSPTALKATREQSIQLMVGAAMKGGPATVPWPYAPGELLYGRDAARGAVLACLKESLKERVFHIGTGEIVSGEEIVRSLKRHFPTADITLSQGKRVMPYPEEKIPHDISLARRELGYEPEYLLERALADYALTLRRMEQR